MQTRSLQKQNEETAKFPKRVGETTSPELDLKRPRNGEVEFVDDTNSSLSEEEAPSYNALDEMELLKQTDPEAYKEIQHVSAEIEKHEPTILKILKEPLCLESKTRLVQLYEVYRNSPPCTEETLDLRKKLINEFAQAREDYMERSKMSYTRQKEIEAEVETFSSSSTGNALFYKIMNLNTSITNKEVIHRKYLELSSTDPADNEYAKIKQWLKWAVEIPHDNIHESPSTLNTTDFLKKASDSLNESLYGMDSVKEQLLLFLSGKLLNPNMKRCNLGLVGPPGTGKTAIAKALADIMDYPFEQISFGGVSDAEFIKGHDYTYIGAQPGEFTRCLRRMKCKNGVMFMDEYEKITDSKEVCAALLHITDPIQNFEFRDNYLNEITQDLSNIWMIYSMNSLPEDSALRDRIFSIDVTGYNSKEKIHIVENYLLPKALKNAGLPPMSAFFQKDSVSFLINRVCDMWDRGVRSVEKAVIDIVNKIAFILNHQPSEGVLTDFTLSFDVGRRLESPVVIDTELISVLCTTQNINKAIEHMYI